MQAREDRCHNPEHPFTALVHPCILHLRLVFAIAKMLLWFFDMGGSRQKRQQAKAAPMTARERWLVILAYWTGWIAWIGLGYVFIDHHQPFWASALFLVATVQLIIGVWLRFRSHWIKVIFVVIALAVFSWADWKWVVPRPSYAFLVPIPGGGNTDFFVNHRGPDSSESVEMMFTDEAMKDKLSDGGKIGIPDPFHTYIRVLHFPEVNPGNRGHVLLQQFMWNPPVQEHQHYTVRIAAKDRTVFENLRVEQQNGIWYYALSITNETGETLFDCQDKGFPGAGNVKKESCLPSIINTE